MDKPIKREQTINGERVTFSTTPVYEAAAKFVTQRSNYTYPQYIKTIILHRPPNHPLSLSHYIRSVITRDTLYLAQQKSFPVGLPV